MFFGTSAAACLKGFSAVLLMLAFALAAPMAAGATTAAGSRGTAAATDALTGSADAASLVPEPVCPPATADTFTCYAQVLVTRAGHRSIHPRLRAASTPGRTVSPFAAPFASLTPATAPAQEPQVGTPAYLQQAYDLGWLSQTAGGGDTVAVVDAYDDPDAASDLAVYRSTFGLPACTTAGGCFRKLNETGGTSYPSQNTGWDTEISLDLDAVSALCPNCHIVLVEASSDYDSDLLQAQAEAAALGAKQISDSFGGPSAAAPYGTFTFNGVQTVAAAGDSGYLGVNQNQYPAALAGVTSAGATSLDPSQTARGFTESAWSDTGSGCDNSQSKPSYQSDSGCAGRTWNDISADGDPATGMDVYDTYDGGWEGVGGTSESSPLIAAYYALVGTTGAPAWDYHHASAMFDPASGSNGSCSPAEICNAGPGYDAPTGIGSISGAVVPGAPGIGAPGPSGNYTPNPSAYDVQLDTGVYPNSSSTSYYIQYGTSTSYGQQTVAVTVGSGPGLVPTSPVLVGLTPDSTYHYRIVAQNAYGTTYGYDVTMTTPAQSPPAIFSATADPTSTTTATLGGVVDGEGHSATYFFKYGGTASYGYSTTPMTAPASGPTRAQAQLTGLVPGGTYHYALFVTYNGGSTVSSTDQSFTTPTSTGSGVARPQTPRIGKPSVRKVSQSSATIVAAVDGHGSGTVYELAWGTSSKLAHMTALARLSGANASVTLKGLKARTSYYAQLVVSNATGASRSAVVKFATSPGVRLGKVRQRAGDRVALSIQCGQATCHLRVQLLMLVDGRQALLAGAAVRLRGGQTRTVLLRMHRVSAYRAAADRGSGASHRATLRISERSGSRFVTVAQRMLTLG
jgi:hypothetical protein